MPVDATVWIKRIDDALAVHALDEPERIMYRDALDDDFDPMVAGVMSMRDRAPPGTRRQVVLNILDIYVCRLQGLIGDNSPELTFDRSRVGDAGIGSIDLAGRFVDGVEAMLCDVTERGGLPEEFREAIPNVATDGSVGMLVSMPAMPTADEVKDASKGSDAILGDAMEGKEPEASRYQDHDTNAAALVQAVGQPLDPNDPASPTMEEVAPDHAAAVEGAAIEQAKAGDKAHAGPVFIERNAFEFKRLAVGSELLWDAAANETKVPRCGAMYRRVVVTRGEAKGYASLRPEWVEALPTYSQVYDDRGGSHLDRTTEGSTLDDPDEDSMLVEFFEVQDARERKLHVVARGAEGYGEVDDTYPYLDKKGEPIFPNFFSVDVIAPFKIVRDTPRKPYGKPLLRAGWDAQCQLILTDTAISAGVCRAGRDIYGMHESLPAGTKELIEGGASGGTYTCPPNVEPSKSVARVDFGEPPDALWQLRQSCLNDASLGLRFPLVDLTMKPTEGATLGQERMGSQQGEVASSDIAQQFEKSYGRCAGMVWAAIRLTWRDEAFWSRFAPGLKDEIEGHLAQQALLMDPTGATPPASFDWRETVLSDLPIRARFAPQTRDSDPMRVEQLATQVQPALIAAGMDPAPVARALSRAAGLGAPQPMALDPMAMGGMPGGAVPRADEPREGGGGRGGPEGRPANRRGRGGKPGGGGSQGPPGKP